MPDKEDAMEWKHAPGPIPLFIILCIIALLAGSGCGLSRGCMSGAPPLADSLPVREVATVVVIDEDADRRAIERLISESAGILYQQAGIRLVIRDRLTIRWRHSSTGGTLKELVDTTKAYGKPFDLAIGFYDMGILDRLAYDFAGGWQGVIDDVYRKFIVLRRDDLHVLMHELGHAFLLEHSSGGGIMSSYVLCAVGDHMCDNYAVCFSRTEREEILRNKWRDFSVKPDLKEREDLVEGLTYFRDWPAFPMGLSGQFVAGENAPAPAKRRGRGPDNSRPITGIETVT